MWIRKSENDIQEYLDQQEAKKKGLFRPFLFALMLSVIATVIYSMGYRGGWFRGGVVLVSSPDGLGLRTIFSFIFLFVFFFALALFNRRRQGSLFHSSENLLCRECTQPSSGLLAGFCSCGGKLEPFAFFNWVEDEKMPDQT